MITLYKYLRESIFDDEEDVLDNSILNSIDKELKELDELFATKHGESPLSSSIKDDTLFLLDTYYKGIDQKVYDKIKDLKDLTGFTNINTQGLVSFEAPTIDSVLGDEIICSRMRFGKNVNIVKDIRLTFDNQMDYYGYILQSEDDVTFQNVEFKYKIKDANSCESTFCFRGVPTFKNCTNLKGLEQIYIHRRDVLKHHWITKKINDFLDDKHIATYRDSKIADKYHEHKGDLKTLITTVKMQKKYMFNSSENGKSFKIKPNAKLKDIMDIDGFKELNHIRITDESTGVRIDFYKGELNPNFTKLPNCVKLPKDDWYMVIEKIIK